jgi:hypothetical protein
VTLDEIVDGASRERRVRERAHVLEQRERCSPATAARRGADELRDPHESAMLAASCTIAEWTCSTSTPSKAGTRTCTSMPRRATPRGRCAKSSPRTSAIASSSDASTSVRSARIRHGATSSRSRPAQFPEVVAWLALNHGALDVFVHPNTSDELRDHRDSAIWIGKSYRLDLRAVGG